MPAISEMAYRDATRRGHKLLGCYLALCAWTQGLDCVVLRREDYLGFFLLGRMEDTRVQWLEEDLKETFPYVRALYDDKTEVFSVLYLSRREFPTDSWKPIRTEERIEMFRDRGLACDFVSIPREEDMVAILAKAVHGLGFVMPKEEPQ